MQQQQQQQRHQQLQQQQSQQQSQTAFGHEKCCAGTIGMEKLALSLCFPLVCYEQMLLQRQHAACVAAAGATSAAGTAATALIRMFQTIII